MRREVFEQVGLFDAGARANEDAELNQRIIEAGGKVYLSKDMVSFYYPARLAPRACSRSTSSTARAARAPSSAAAACSRRAP